MSKVDVSQIKELRRRTAAGVMDCKRALVEAGPDIDAAVELLETRRQLPATTERRVTPEGLVAYQVDGQRAVAIELAAETDFVARNPKFREAAAELARASLSAEGTLERALAAPAPDGRGEVADYVRRMAASFGENLHLRRVSHLDATEGAIGAYAHNSPAHGLGRMVAMVSVRGEGSEDEVAEFARKLAIHIVGAAPLWTSVDQVSDAVRDQKRLASGEGVGPLGNTIDARLERFYDETVLLRQRYLLDPSKTVAQALADVAGPKAGVEGFVCLRVGEDASHDKRVAEAAEFEWTFGNDWSSEKPTRLLALDGTQLFEVARKGPKLRDDRDATDLINAAWSHGATVIALPVDRLADDFFPLSTRKAGAILQKFSNFGARLAIIGDLTPQLTNSKALRDFVYESNRRGQVLFLPDMIAITQRLRRSTSKERER